MVGGERKRGEGRWGRGTVEETDANKGACKKDISVSCDNLAKGG